MLKTALTPEMLFASGYLEAARFTDGGPDHPEIENAEFSAETYQKAMTQCMAFRHAARSDLERAVQQVGYDWVRAGHDFWFTRNGHGVGFWDRRELDEDLGRRLSDAARRFGEVSLELGDDGFLILE